MGIIEKIKEIEAEMARTQKNKATGTHSLPSVFILLTMEFPQKVIFFVACLFFLTFF